MRSALVATVVALGGTVGCQSSELAIATEEVPAAFAGPVAGSEPLSGCDVATTLNFDIEGYGAETVGGYQSNPTVVCVTSLDDDGPGTLREALRTDGRPTVIGFAVDGVIPLSSRLFVPSNVTIDGRGHDVRLDGKGLLMLGIEQVIVTHIALQNIGPDSDDGIQIGNTDGSITHHIVLDHLTLSQEGEGGNSENVDEAISIIFGSTDITIAWTWFRSWEKIILAGNGDAPPSVDSNIRLTVHHCHFEDTGRRHPQARYGIFDFYNNYLNDWHMFSPVGPPIWHESFGAQCEDDCRLIYEQNVFERHWHQADLFSQANHASRCETGGALDDRGGFVMPETSVRLRFGVTCPTVSIERPYEATIEPADEGLAERLVLGAGHLPVDATDP